MHTQSNLTYNDAEEEHRFRNNPSIDNADLSLYTVDNEFAIEKNVRKAIEDLEILTSKVAKKEISGSQIISSILD